MSISMSASKAVSKSASMSPTQNRFRGLLLVSLAVSALSAAACSTTAASPGYTIIKGNESSGPSSGLAPDKEAEVQLVLQQREVSTRKCYQDVLSVKQDRSFAGTVKVLIALGTDRTAREVKVIGGTLQDAEVTSCLVETIKNFEFPELTQPGEVQSEFTFRPAY